ncbi:unnamed protein product [Polarella glacialis]|uniref:Uncharacterized protein n=2 Tax=Polarella glacialis TaxID=89957 RepID=A0A813KZG4_POLGL|nr:unnamed protein product [Polarella glacialis]
MSTLACTALPAMASAGRSPTPAMAVAGNSARPRPSGEQVLSVPYTPLLSARHTMGGSSPRSQRSLNDSWNVEESFRSQTAGPLSSPRPLPGRLGTVCPGGQYWPPHWGNARYRPEDMISRSAATYVAPASREPYHYRSPPDPSSPEGLRKTSGSKKEPSIGYGTGTGYCPNTASIFGVEWAHKDGGDQFRTTYNDTCSSGIGLPKLSATSSTASSSMTSSRDWRRREL